MARDRFGKFFAPVEVGKSYLVKGYHTGDFFGEVERVGRSVALVRVIDPMRPAPRVKNRCSFAGCVKKDWHDGDHEFARVHEGSLVEVWWESAKWIPAPARKLEVA